jgi:hypothetical protein
VGVCPEAGDCCRPHSCVCAVDVCVVVCAATVGTPRTQPLPPVCVSGVCVDAVCVSGVCVQTHPAGVWARGCVCWPSVCRMWGPSWRTASMCVTHCPPPHRSHHCQHHHCPHQGNHCPCRAVDRVCVQTGC